MRNDAANVMGNTVWLMLQRISGRLIAFALMIYLARGLGSLNFGKLIFAVSFTSLFVMLSDMGIITLTIREVARQKEQGPDYVGNAAILKLMLSLIAFAAIAICAVFIKVPQDTRIAIYLIGGYAIMENLGSLFGAVFQAHENMKYLTISEVIQKLFLFLLAVILLGRGRGLISISFAYFFSGALYCIINAVFVHWKFMKPRYRVNIQFWKDTLKESLPLAIVAAISMIYYNTDIVMVGKMKGEETAGWYGVGYQIFFTLATVPGAFLSAAFPAMSRFFKESDGMLKKAYRKSFKIIFAAGLPVSIGTYLLSEKIIVSLFGPGYYHSAAALKIFSFIIMFSYMNNLAGYFLTSVNRQKLTAKILGFTTVLNVVLNFLLIPRFSYVGAVYATMVSEILFFAIFFMCLPKDFRFIPVEGMFSSVVSSVIMGIAIKVMNDSGVNVVIVAGSAILIYFIFMLLTGFFTAGEKSEFKKAFFGGK